MIQRTSRRTKGKRGETDGDIWSQRIESRKNLK